MPTHKAGAGRKPGSKNKRTKELEALLEKQLPGWDPVVWMAHLAANGVAPDTLQVATQVILLLEGTQAKSPPHAKRIRKACALLEQLIGGETLDRTDRIFCAKEVAQYVRPKRKAIEIKGGDEGSLPIRVVQNLGPKACPHCGEDL